MPNILSAKCWHTWHTTKAEPKKRFGALNAIGVLVVTDSYERLEKLKGITEETGGRSMFWFACSTDISLQSVLTEPIWHLPHTAEQKRLL